MEKKARNVQFITAVQTGEQPDAEFHLVGFEESDGIAIEGKHSGNVRIAAMLLSTACERFVRDLKESQGVLGAAAFVCATNMAMANAGGNEVLEMADKMIDPEKMIGAITEALERMTSEGDEE